MSEFEKDLHLKLQIMRYLWRIGYLVFKNVELTPSTPSRKKTYTDIDVLGLRITPDLDTNFIVCDCKSGRVKTAERLFWLSGIMKFFDSDHGLFIRPEMLTTNYFELSERLKITPLTNSQLEEVIRSYNINSENYYGPFCKEQILMDDIFKSVRKKEKNIINYLLIDYWKDLPQKQILTLISMYKRISNTKINEREFVWSYIHSLLSLSIIRFSKQFLMIPNIQREGSINNSLLGGEISYIERERLLKNFYTFMVNEIKVRYNQNYPVSKEDFISGMIPSYSKYLIDLVSRICKNPESSVLIPRFFNVILYEKVLNNRDIKLEQLFTGVPVKIMTLKPIKDFITFLERSNIIDDTLKETYQNGVLSIEKKLPESLDYYLI